MCDKIFKNKILYSYIMKIICKYLSSDQYSHPSFVSTSEIHNATYLTLVRLSNKLKSEFPNSYLNVYQNDSDIIYLKTTVYRNNLWAGGTYEIECVPIVKVNNKSQKYVVLKLIDLTRIKEDQDEIYDF